MVCHTWCACQRSSVFFLSIIVVLVFVCVKERKSCSMPDRWKKWYQSTSSCQSCSTSSQSETLTCLNISVTNVFFFFYLIKRENIFLASIGALSSNNAHWLHTPFSRRLSFRRILPASQTMCRIRRIRRQLWHRPSFRMRMKVLKRHRYSSTPLVKMKTLTNASQQCIKNSEAFAHSKSEEKDWIQFFCFTSVLCWTQVRVYRVCVCMRVFEIVWVFLLGQSVELTIHLLILLVCVRMNNHVNRVWIELVKLAQLTPQVHYNLQFLQYANKRESEKPFANMLAISNTHTIQIETFSRLTTLFKENIWNLTN